MGQAVATPSLPVQIHRKWDRVFFSAMALALVATAFIGFSPTYYLAQAGSKPLTPLMHLHGLVATAWMLVYLAQNGLVAGRRVDLHRKLGSWAMYLALIFVVLTTLTAFASAPRLRVFQAGAVLMFMAFVVGGWVSRRQPDSHKRFMLLATIAMIPPAFARLQLPFPGPVGANIGGLLFLIPPLIYDLATRRRLHPVLLWGGLLMIIMLPARIELTKLLA